MVYKTHRHVLRVLAGSLTLLLLSRFSPLLSQDTANLNYLEIREDAEERYGPSADLFNGEKYYYPYRSAGGDPFFEVHNDHNASALIKGKLYENQTIRFDIYNQLMVLDFMDRSGAPGSIVLRNEWLDYIILGGYLFKKFPDQNGFKRFGQVIYEGNYSCVYFWEKSYSPDLHDGEKYYQFSEPIRQSLLVVDDRFYPYAGKRSFLTCFPGQNQLQIKTYLKEKRIRIRKATDLEMQSLMEYLNQLSDHED